VIYRIAADGLVVLHTLFVLFVVLGGFLVLRWPHVAWLHLPAAVWGALIEFTGCICPLTPLEKSFRSEAGYTGGFINHYIVPLLYPSGLDRGWQVILGTLVVVLNLAIYGRLLVRGRQGKGVKS
jgi:hypothetical protein